MLKLLFKFFLELIFARQEEYDFKSKHFKPSKVIFTGVVFLSFVLNFFLLTGIMRITIKYIDLHAICGNTETIPAKIGDKNQSPGSSDSQKPHLEYNDDSY